MNNVISFDEARKTKDMLETLKEVGEMMNEKEIPAENRMIYDPETDSIIKL
jgi:hypothetical protein